MSLMYLCLYLLYPVSGCQVRKNLDFQGPGVYCSYALNRFIFIVNLQGC